VRDTVQAEFNGVDDLSIVLWTMTLGGAFDQESPVTRVIMIVVSFYLWFEGKRQCERYSSGRIQWCG
jgi:hypothetical protein